MPEETTETIQSEHFPEVANKANRRLELLKVSEKLRTPEERREFFKNLSDERFKKMLGYINSLTRGKKLDEEYEDGKVPGTPTPPLEDKDVLMKASFEAVRNILANDNLDNADALQIAGLTLAGAVNYIHPYENGNGRVGRVGHYLIEFGNQRGKEALQSELYAAIGKLEVYDTDKIRAIDNTPPPELERALYRQIPEENAQTDDRKQASERVGVFLKMMQGDIQVPIFQEVPVPTLVDNIPKFKPVQAGKIDGLELYRQSYLARSSVPNREPNETPQNAKRIKGVRSTTEPIMISMDLV